jgi:hypothetical protein
MAGFDLRAEQVELQVRMHPADLGRIVAPAVVALGKNIDRIDVRQLERFLELLLREMRPDIRQMFRGVKIQMNLAGSCFLFGLHNTSC